jgi:hypothetical protein
MGEAVEKGVGIDDNRLSHCERRPSPQSEGQVRDEAVESESSLASSDSICDSEMKVMFIKGRD